ncbi:MAG TPA: sigma-70 family RNA polymerase sigma factor [Actinomycetota bacterium]|nr:sigma-70 family RNA polymerase sigma factor [Actinomycetota bacterium]
MGRALKDLSDKELVKLYQAGERAAYDEMYARYSPKVMAICSRMLGRAPEAEEATQETFLKAYQALPRFNGQYQLGAWLTRIASNVCLDQIRVRTRSVHSVALPPEEVLGTQDGPEEALAGGDGRVDETIAGIQPLHARALQMRAVADLSHREMAAQLSMSPEQVKALLHRARASFKRAWEKAENFALAPVFFVRSLFENRRDGTDAGSFASVASNVSPLLSERVAAGAVFVVAALTALPSTPAAPVAPEERTLYADQLEWKRVPELNWVRVDGPAVTQPASEEPAASEPSSDDGLLDPVLALGRGAGGSLGGDGNDGGSSDPGKDLGGRASAASKTTLAQVRVLVKKVESLIKTLGL